MLATYLIFYGIIEFWSLLASMESAMNMAQLSSDFKAISGTTFELLLDCLQKVVTGHNATTNDFTVCLKMLGVKGGPGA